MFRHRRCLRRRRRGGVSSIAQTYGTAQTGALTFATSTATSFNGLTISNAITNSGGAFTFAPPTITGTLSVAGGGTGQGTFTSSQLLYGNGGNALSGVATSSIAVGAGISVTSGTLGAQVGGDAVTLGIANNALTLAQLPQIAANSILGNNTGALGNVTSFATSTLGINFADLTGSATDGQVTDALTISGGTINNTTIGASTPATGVFTNASTTNFAVTGITSSLLKTNGSGSLLMRSWAPTSSTPPLSIHPRNSSPSSTTKQAPARSSSARARRSPASRRSRTRPRPRSRHMTPLRSVAPRPRLFSGEATATSTFAGGVSATRLSASATSTLTGLRITSEGLVLVGFNCSGSTGLLQTDASGNVICGTDDSGAGGGIATLQVDDSDVVTTATILDFLGTDFDLTNSPAGEGNLSIDYLNGQAASASLKGFLTSSDWSLFNNKVSSTSIDTSAELISLLTDETGTGALVFGTSPTLLGISQIANASTTALSAYTAAFGATATSTFSSSGALTLASALGVSSGGTGLTATPSFGQILRGTGTGYTLVATSTLGVLLSDTTGTLGETRGGTNQSTYATGDILYASGANTLSKLTLGTAGTILASAGGIPAWVATTTFSSGLAYAGGNVTNTGLLSLAQSSGSAQTGAITLATSTTAIGNDWGITNSGGTFTWNVPTAAAAIRGLLSGTDWTTFNNKQAALSATWPQILTGSTLSFGGLSTSTAAIQGNIPYFSGVNTFANVATSSLAVGNGLTVTSGALGNQIGGSAVNIGLATINAGVLGAVTNGAVPTSQATSTLYGVGIGGQVLGWSNVTGGLAFVATSTSGGGLTAIGPTGQTQTGPSVTFATSSTAFNGLTASTTIVGSGNTLTFTNTLAGTLGTGAGGTGLTATPSFGQILRGTGTGYTLVATSTLGVLLSDTTGILGETRGGTNQSTYATGDILYASGANTLSKLTLGTAGTILASAGGIPSWVATTTFSSGLAYAGGNVTNTGLLSLAQTYGTAQTGAITLATSTTAIGNDWGITNSGGTFTWNVPTATAAIRGLLSGTDWTTFNNKQAALSATWPQILTGSTLSFGGLSTSTAAIQGNIPYFSGVNTFANVATSSLAVGNGLTVTSGALGNQIGGSAVNIGLATINAGVLGAVTNGAVPTSQATSTLYGVGIGGQVLGWSNVTGGLAFVATSTSGGGLTAIGPAGQTQSGPSVTFATSSTAFNGLTASTTIVGSGNTLTFTNTLAGTLGTGAGGTGLTATPSFGQILRGTGTGYTLVATSTLGVLLSDTTGILGETRGGTNQSTYATGDILYASGANTLSKLTLGTAGTILASSAGIPSWVATTTFSSGLAYANGNVTNTGLLSLAQTYGTAQTGAITLATSTTAIGNDWGITNSGGTFTWNVPTATAAIRGLLSGTDWTTFNNKQAALSATWPQILTGSTLSFGGLSTSTAAIQGNIPYFSGVNTFANVATSSLAVGNGLTVTSGALGNQIGGSAVNIGLATINAGVLGAVTNGAVPTSQATSTLYGVGIGGQVLGWSNVTGGLAFVATSTSGGGLTAIGPAGQTQTGPSVTFATSSTAFNGLTASTTIVGSGNTLTFTNTLAGTLGTGAGGTGLTATPSFGQILRGTGTGYTLVATSTLGVLLSDTTGILGETRGGTNQSTYATGDILYASGANTLSKLTLGTAGTILASAGGIPSWVATTTFSSGLAYAGGNVTNTGLLSLAQSSGSAQTGAITLATSTTAIGNDWGITNSGGTFTWNIPTATAAIRGLLSGTDWTTFNNKQAALSATWPQIPHRLHTLLRRTFHFHRRDPRQHSVLLRREYVCQRRHLLACGGERTHRDLGRARQPDRRLRSEHRPRYH